MQRNMDLVREILLAIEAEYVDTAIIDLEIDGYDMNTVAYHCKILKDAYLISNYKGLYGDNRLLNFYVGNLTWEGHEFLDKIRIVTVWDKTKETIATHGLPLALDVIKTISSTIIAGLTEGVARALNL